MKLALAVAIGSQKKWPAQLHLQCQVNSVHGDFPPADQHDGKRSLRAFALDGVHLFVCAAWTNKLGARGRGCATPTGSAGQFSDPRFQQ